MGSLDIGAHQSSQLSSVHYHVVPPSRSPRTNSPTWKIGSSSKSGESHCELPQEQDKDIIQEPSTKRIVKTIFLHVAITAAVISTFVALLFTTLGLTSDRSIPGSCSPDGTFRYRQQFNPWAASGFFQISLGFGSMSFSNAKLIDVVWDLVIGRGGQGLLGYIAYSVFTKSMVRTMEQRPVSYSTFEAITFRTSTAFSLWLMVKDYTTNGGPRAKAAITWMIIASVYVLAFPTLMSAVTGYASNSQGVWLATARSALITSLLISIYRPGFIKNVDDNLLPLSSLLPVIYIIHDGWRIGLEGNAIVSTFQRLPGQAIIEKERGSMSDACEEYYPLPRHYRGYGAVSNQILDWNMPRECFLLSQTGIYVQMFGLGRNANVNSTFNNSGNLIDLPPPLLNISSFYASSYAYPGVKYTLNATRFTSELASNDTFDSAYLEENGSCQPTNTYRWGFSFLLLFASVVLTSLWALGMHIMWLDAYFQSRYDRANRAMGIHRATLDFASAIIKDTGGEVPPEGVSERELLLRRRKALNGGKIPRLPSCSTNADHDGQPQRTRAEALREYLNRRRWGRVLRKSKWLLIVVAAGSGAMLIALPVTTTRLTR